MTPQLGERPGLVLTICLAWALGACARRPQFRDFHHQAEREHPLVGRVWDARDERWVKRRELERAVAAHRYVLLGESHDNVDHHLIQRDLLERWLEAHPRGAVAFEQLDAKQGRALARAQPETAEAVRVASAWNASGWPDFVLYEPLINLALTTPPGPVAAHPARAALREAMADPRFMPDADLQLEPPPAENLLEDLRQEIIEAHCGHAPEAMIEPMVKAQRFKDAYMARAMVQTQRPTLLIAGTGHVRSDRGVPYYLARHGQRDTLSVALLPVREDAHEPSAYEADAYDYVVFTTRTSARSACERFEAQLRHMRERSHDAEPANPAPPVP